MHKFVRVLDKYVPPSKQGYKLKNIYNSKAPARQRRMSGVGCVKNMVTHRSKSNVIVTWLFVRSSVRYIDYVVLQSWKNSVRL